ncbi:hypothetical protein R1flu_026746 [Riccia fluitans]|uniref:Uncharacterized protein n=1 Tax=Riccia fluitans TaxID=41844 RepID=A0ABD1XKV6_9MARC
MLECNILRRRSRAKWIEKGESCSRYFFAILWAKQANERMTMLRDKEGREVWNEEDILSQVYKYYTELYTQPIVSSAERQEQNKVLTLIEHHVSDEDNFKLMELPGSEELSEADQALPLQKSPGEDGLPVKVLRELWDEIGPCCLKFVQEAWHTKRIGKWIKVANTLRSRGLQLDRVQEDAIGVFQNWLGMVRMGIQKLENSASWRWKGSESEWTG